MTTITQATRDGTSTLATINVGGKTGSVKLYSDGSTLWTPAWLERRYYDSMQATGRATAKSALKTAIEAAADKGISADVTL
jgi:hypothetical protein